MTSTPRSRRWLDPHEPLGIGVIIDNTPDGTSAGNPAFIRISRSVEGAEYGHGHARRVRAGSTDGGSEASDELRNPLMKSKAEPRPAPTKKASPTRLMKR